MIKPGDKDKCKILGIHKVGKDSSKSIFNAYLVDTLKFNLLSVSQLCDKGNHVIFDKEKYVVKNLNTSDIFITALRYDNVYALHINEITVEDFKCLKRLNRRSKAIILKAWSHQHEHHA